jgi:hypothetical protein
MERWIPPAVVAFLALCWLAPWVVAALLIMVVMVLATTPCFSRRTPPPYLSLTEDGRLRINWLMKVGGFPDEPAPLAWRITLEGEPGDAHTVGSDQPHECTRNEYTGAYAVVSVVLPALTPGRRYAYAIWDESTPGRPHRLFGGSRYWLRGPLTGFSEIPLRVAALGDLQPKRGIPPLLQWYVLHRVRKARPDLLLNLGDHTMEGIDLALWRMYLNVIGVVARNTPVLGVPGNHDLALKRRGGIVRGVDAYRTYVNYPGTKTCYATHFGGLHLLGLPFEGPYGPGSPTHDLVARETNAHDPRDWLVTLWHSSPHNTLKLTPDAAAVREHIVPLIHEAGGRLWFGGHEHTYQRFVVDGAHYVTTAATSSFHRHDVNREGLVVYRLKFHFVQFEVEPQAVRVTAVPILGRSLDEFVITR